MGFDGAKLALYLGEKLAVILRDDTPGLLFADHWDLPGGGREGAETPLACALRECHEELGIRVPEEAVVWQGSFDEAGRTKWFFVARMPAQAEAEIVFGDEGQRWRLMDEDEFLTHPRAVPAFQDRLRVYLTQTATENAQIVQRK
ncbi:NUDIX hydrolase [Sulfitobacter sp. W027]|uniref:NUDIX hydrolase n=1 Tax=Sulfitobacter sp. W027 TaxID=2867025 RepID=UPI0021A45A8C|nr:NUDIX hydrolase [Sulfitobacter sp. W027]UWR33966.1 NUDIX hydrolase [Sulfitobacter sp. W027]